MLEPTAHALHPDLWCDNSTTFLTRIDKVAPSADALLPTALPADHSFREALPHAKNLASSDVDGL